MSDIKRKIIVCPELVSSARKGRALDPITDPSLVRRLMLYWDQIVYLDHNHNLICSDDDNFLRGEGVLDVLTFTFNVKKMERYNPIAAQVIYETTLSDAFRFASERYKAVWSYLQPSWKPDASILDAVPVVELKLYNLLPVPNEDTPLDDILKFKRRRADELRALRIALDDLIQGVRQASEPLRGLDKATMTVRGCLEDLRRVVDEGLATRLLNTLKVTVNLPTLVGGALGGRGPRRLDQPAVSMSE